LDLELPPPLLPRSPPSRLLLLLLPAECLLDPDLGEKGWFQKSVEKTELHLFVKHVTQNSLLGHFDDDLAT
jgi:hypothetical protein